MDKHDCERSRSDAILNRGPIFVSRIIHREASMSVNVLIAFYSRTGSTEALALSIAEGATDSGAAVRLRRARELVSAEVIRGVPGWTETTARMNERYEPPTEADAEWADAIIFGSPTRFGSVCAELKAYIDGLGDHGRLTLRNCEPLKKRKLLEANELRASGIVLSS
jgi:multimeric flavodoxin WrbA